MSRWRAPPTKASPYITPEGYARLKDEYESIWKRRAEVTRALTAAAAEGDRSENAEYIYRKKELGSLDSRIRYLQTRLAELNIVDRVSDVQRVFFGAKITLISKAGVKTTVRLVGSDELDNSGTNISIDSPLARALLGKTFNDEISCEINNKIMSYQVADIAY